ncbi:hypothetical protein BPTFM16_00664 [Altererythrobacter insulae]|nr:hypothetical protein BPTFM16_00664 [Altererythrobacter insulae]
MQPLALEAKQERPACSQEQVGLSYWNDDA